VKLESSVIFLNAKWWISAERAFWIFFSQNGYEGVEFITWWDSQLLEYRQLEYLDGVFICACMYVLCVMEGFKLNTKSSNLISKINGRSTSCPQNVKSWMKLKYSISHFSSFLNFYIDMRHTHWRFKKTKTKKNIRLLFFSFQSQTFHVMVASTSCLCLCRFTLIAVTFHCVWVFAVVMYVPWSHEEWVRGLESLDRLSITDGCILNNDKVLTFHKVYKFLHQFW